MRKYLTILSLFFCLQTQAQTTYYVSASGNDANNGTSTSTPFKSVLHVTQTVLNVGGMPAGSQVLFNRGDVFPCGSDNVNIDFRISGTSGNNILVGAYGTGANPIIDGSRDLPNWQTSANWTNTTGNIWRIGAGGSSRRIWVNGTEWAQAASSTTPTASEPFSQDGTNVYLYSAGGNPATTFSTIKIPLDASGVVATNQNYITVENLDIRGFSGAIDFEGCSNILFQKDSIGYNCQGTGIYTKRNGTTTESNILITNNTFNTKDKIFHSWEAKSTEDGVHIEEGTNNIEVSHCSFIDWGHAANYWLIPLSSAYHITNCAFKNNFYTSPDINYGYGPCADFGNDLNSKGNNIDSNYIYHTGLALQLNGAYVNFFNNVIDGTYGNTFYSPEGGGIDLTGYYSYPQFMRIYNNTIINCTGYAISLHNSTGDSIIQHNLFANNILAFNKGELSYQRGTFTFQQLVIEEHPQILSDTFKNNLLYSPNAANTVYYGHAPSPYIINVPIFNSYNGTQGDVISGNIAGDPLLNANYTLKAGSPAIGAGINLNVGIDIGAYAYAGAAPTIVMSGNQIVNGTTATVSATGTAAPGHTITGYSWTKLSGTGTITSPASSSTGLTSLVGTSAYQCTVTQNDGQTASGTLSITAKQLATMTYSNTTQTYTGSPLSVTVTTSPAGLSGVNTTYNNLVTLPTGAGSYTLNSSLTNDNFYASNITGTFTINKATAIITVGNTNQTYTGSPLSVTATVSPSVSGLAVTYNGSSTAPTNAGTYTVIATLTNANYTATPDTVTFTINKKVPTVSWPTPAAITYGTALSATQLNATASVGGIFAYTPASGTILNAGTSTLSVNFTPTDGTNYQSVNNTTVSLTVNKATATITLSNLAQNFDGTPKPVTVTTNPVGLTVITTTYNGSTTVPSAVGSYTINSTLINSNYTATPATGTLVISSSAATIFITNYSGRVYTGSPITPTVTCAYSFAITYNGSGTAPTNVGSYTAIATINDGIHTGADTVTMTIIKAIPVIIWATPASITFGTALSGTQLNASSATAGTFAYSPISGTILNAVTNVLSTTFTPTDASNYNSATATVIVTVNKATATISASNFSQVYDGSPKPITATVSPAVSGLTVTYNGSTTAPTNANSYAVIVSLTNSNYTATSVTGTLVISKVSPILSWTKPAQIDASTALSTLQIDATSNVPGTFSYNYSIGQKLPPGTYGLTATFTPTDATNYNSGTVTTTLTVTGSPYILYYLMKGKSVLYPNK